MSSHWSRGRSFLRMFWFPCWESAWYHYIGLFIPKRKANTLYAFHCSLLTWFSAPFDFYPFESSSLLTVTFWPCWSLISSTFQFIVNVCAGSSGLVLDQSTKWWDMDSVVWSVYFHSPASCHHYVLHKRCPVPAHKALNWCATSVSFIFISNSVLRPRDVNRRFVQLGIVCIVFLVWQGLCHNTFTKVNSQYHAKMWSTYQDMVEGGLPNEKGNMLERSLQELSQTWLTSKFCIEIYC